MTNTNETITDIIAEMRALSNPISDGIIAINGRSIADRLEAAWKREKATTEKSSAVGDMAAMRVALVFAEKAITYAICDPQFGDNVVYLVGCMKTVSEKCRAALAEPPRNCDKYSHDEALRIWSAEPENPMNGCFDDWLYAPATEQKGGAK